ncbi:MAG: hypothetical protein ACP5IG_02080 [Candidatus Micrarchaeia archaeon]
MVLKRVLWALCVLLFAGSAAAYSDYSFSVNVKVNHDGSAHVTEKTVIIFSNDLEKEEFDAYLNTGENSVLEWKKFSRNVRYHFSGEIVRLATTKITARREYGLSFQAGSIMVDYDVDSSLFDAEKTSSRLTTYSLHSSYLSFDLSKNKEMVLGNGMQLRFVLPSDAYLVEAAPAPDSLEGNVLTWNGPLVGSWKIVYSVEQPLAEEVNQFFADFYENMFGVVPFVLLVGVIAFVAVKLWRSKQ